MSQIFLRFVLLAFTLSALLACRDKTTAPPAPSPRVVPAASVAPGPPPAVANVVTNAAAPPTAPAHLILVSIDGGRPDIVQQARMPTLHAMAREGAVTWSARSIVPPLTLPAHTSMLTGLAPEEHGVYWNQWMPAFGTLRFPTVLALARTAGFSTAMFSAKDKLAYLFPTGSVDHISYPVPDPRDWMGTNHLLSATTVATQAVTYFAQQKPRLMFVHFPDADLAGHFFGWPSPEQFAALETCDAALARLREGVARAGATNVLYLVTADHGGAGLSHGVDRPQDMAIFWFAWGAGARRGYALTNQVNMPDTAATIAWRLGFALPPNCVGQPVREAFE